MSLGYINYDAQCVSRCSNCRFCRYRGIECNEKRTMLRFECLLWEVLTNKKMPELDIGLAEKWSECPIVDPKKNSEVIARGLMDFDGLEEHVQECVADYIDCPSESECLWDGDNKKRYLCTECKMNWLGKEFND